MRSALNGEKLDVRCVADKPGTYLYWADTTNRQPVHPRELPSPGIQNEILSLLPGLQATQR
jgi:hypothetical protein